MSKNELRSSGKHRRCVLRMAQVNCGSLSEHLYARLAFLQWHRYTGNKEGSRRICACRMESFMIRFIITALFVILFLILSIPLLIAEWIIGKFNPPLKDRSSLAIVNWAFRMVLRLSGVSVTYIGEDRIPKDTPVLYVGNHRSYFDIVMTYVRVPRTTGYISKVEFLKIPLLSNWMKNLHCLFLDRSDLKAGMKTILAAIEEIKNGVSICIFPEGTRNRTDAPLLEFHAGSLKIAEKAQCPIVPMTIANAEQIFEAHSPCIRKTKVIIEYGEPIETKNLDRTQQKALTSQVVARISETYEKNMKLLSGENK